MAAPGDPRLRPFRVAAYGVYLVIATIFSLAVTISVARSVASMTPSRPDRSNEVLGADECVAKARAAFEELDAHRQGMVHEDGGATEADQRWAAFRLDWLTRVRALEARCGVDLEERAKLKQVFAMLERVLDLYTTQTIQFAGAVGPSVDRLRRAFDEAQ